jgi:hypothetical protein
LSHLSSLQRSFQADGDRRQHIAYLGGGVPTDQATPVHAGDFPVGSFGVAGVASAYLSIFHAEVEVQVADHDFNARPTRPLYQLVHTDQRVWRWERDGEITMVVPCLPDLARGFANAAFSVLGQLREYQNLRWFLCGGEPERLMVTSATHRYSRAVNPLDDHFHFHDGPCWLRHHRYSFGPVANEFYRARLSDDGLVSSLPYFSVLVFLTKISEKYMLHFVKH